MNDLFNPEFRLSNLFNPEVRLSDLFNLYPEVRLPDLFNPEVRLSDLFNLHEVRLSDLFNPEVRLLSDSFNLPEVRLSDLFNPEHFNPKEHYKYNGSSEFLLPGGEMPRWLRGNEEGEISFIVSKNFFKKFMWLAAYVVFQEDERMENFHLCLHALINGKRRMDYMNTVTSSLWDHVCLQIYEMSWLWEILEDVFGKSQFHLMIRADSDSTVVKECGFRLICKPLENDLKDDQLMDPAILYEIQNEDYRTSRSFMEIKPSQEWMDEFTFEKWRYSLISPDLRIVCPGGEMPKEFVFAKDSTISFMASREFFDKFRGLAFCVVIGVEGGEKEISFDIVPQVHGQRRNVLSGTLGSFDLDHVWIQYLEPNVLWGVLEGGVDFGQFNERYLRFSIKLSVSGGIVKRLGYVLRCTQLEDDLKVMLENNQLVDPAILYEDCDGYPEEIGEEFVRRFAHTHREKQEANESETD